MYIKLYISRCRYILDVDIDIYILYLRVKVILFFVIYMIEYKNNDYILVTLNLKFFILVNLQLF